MKRNFFYSTLFLSSSLALFSLNAEAELTVGVLGGVVNQSTTVTGDSVYWGGATNQFRYPVGVSSHNAAVGLFARYLHPMTTSVSLGVETGYTWLDNNETRMRSDDFNQPVENFTVKSNQLITLNAVLGFLVVPDITFNVFAGPAWLQTNYINSDLIHHIQSSASTSFELTGDTGVEADWRFARAWAAGIRYDYIFNSGTRTVATTGFQGTALHYPTKAYTDTSIFSVTLRYAIPRT